QYPQHIYNAMIVPVRPYGIRGMIWYQGERNSKNVPQAAHYQVQLTQMINHYRRTWHEESAGHIAKDFPFQFTQLPSWNPAQTEPAEGITASWTANRESMRQVYRDVPNTAMAVTIDTGDAIELHPKNKQPIGIRHALLALKNTYGQDIVASGPQLSDHVVGEGNVILTFNSVGTGLMTGREGPLDSFAVSGEDGKWHWAEASITGNQITLTSPNEPTPISVRYAWAMNPSERNLLYNREGLPASPFRTDTRALFDPNVEVVEVLKPEKPQGYVSADWKRPTMVAAPEHPLSSSTPATVPQETVMETEAEVADGLAPEVTDLNAADVSFALEAKLPYLEEPFINPRPRQQNDDIPVADFTREWGDRRAILKFAREISAGQHGEVDSFLLMKGGKLIFESYYRRGRANYPHYQMSITKSYTAMALGRAIQCGHLTMEDLDKPVVGFLKELDASKFVPGAENITLAEAMNMHSGIRINQARSKKLMKNPAQLAGQGQIQAYLENSATIPPAPRDYKYQGSDPSLTMQVIEAVVPGTARDFVQTELLGKLGITNFAWQDDISGLPKSAAGSSMRSRDMIKWGMLVMNGGSWKGEQLIPTTFVEKATSRLYTNPQGMSYGFFWWRHDMEVGEQTFDCISGRGAGGQFLFMLPELDLIAVITSHNKGMGKLLKTFPERVLPAFLNPES
ncbi:MAG: serine hydrolase, partial [Verrucomicrobiota bacterium]